MFEFCKKKKRRNFVKQGLLNGLERNNTAVVQQAIDNGADVNVNIIDREIVTTSPPDDSFLAIVDTMNVIVRILLKARANARWKDRNGFSAIVFAYGGRHLPIVKRLLNHDHGLLDLVTRTILHPCLLQSVFATTKWSGS